MRLVFVVVALALVASSAHAQRLGGGSGWTQKPGADRPADPPKPKVDEKEYGAALQRIPDRKAPPDPWSNVRPQPSK